MQNILMKQTLPKIQVGAEAYQQAISSYENAKKLTEIAKLIMTYFIKEDFILTKMDMDTKRLK